MLQEHQQVVFKTSFPLIGIAAGDIGVVVHVYREGESYEVECFAPDGSTTGVATVDGKDLKPA